MAISKNRGPKMNPPPRPRSPPTIPAQMPIIQQRISWCTFQLCTASPLEASTLFPLYSITASYPDAPNATGICKKLHIQYAREHFVVYVWAISSARIASQTKKRTPT
uniref:Uncharacterized protein n=1 Tax=Opuntia streptacantha TaxID=393608 RepID=A0A7C8ZST2_OPUST